MDATRSCPRCGMITPLSANNCTGCGHQFRTPFASPAVPVLAPPPAQVISSPQPPFHLAPSPWTSARFGLGIILFSVGLLMMGGFLLLFDPSVPTSTPGGFTFPGVVVERTINLGLISTRECGCIVGAALTISGAVLIGAKKE